MRLPVRAEIRIVVAVVGVIEPVGLRVRAPYLIAPLRPTPFIVATRRFPGNRRLRRVRDIVGARQFEYVFRARALL